MYATSSEITSTAIRVTEVMVTAAVGKSVSSKEHLVAGLGIGRPTDDGSKPVDHFKASSTCTKTEIVGNYDGVFYFS